VADERRRDRLATAPPSRTVSPLLGGAVAVMALVLLVLAAAATGPWQRRSLPGEEVGTADPVTPPTIEPESVSPTSLPPIDPGSGDGSEVLGWALLALGVIVATALLALVLRYLLGRLRRPGPDDPSSRVASDAIADPEIDAPELLEGIAQAQQILSSDRAPSDAIVQAWLALERAAERAGVARRPSQTPTEFTAVVLERTPAEATAVDTLRRLYLHVRFSDGGVSAADADAAREALAAIARSWSAVGTAS
jgi:hypothetical protein